MKRIPTILAGVYLVAVVFSVVVIFTSGDSLSGIFLVLLGAPWAQLMGRALEAVDPALSSGLIPGLALGVVGGLINATLIYVVARWLVRWTESRRTA